jgi:4-hydroxy-tetrahydrodipicolinate reductase
MSLQLGLIGYGKMGQLIEKLATLRGHQIEIIIDHKQSSFEKLAKMENGLDVVIDFSQPSAAMANLQQVSSLGINYVMGTTGWYSQFDRAQQIVADKQIGFIWSANFSLAVQLLFKIVRQAAKLVNNYPDFDLSVLELHHRHKLDSPSGTALSLAEILLEEVEHKQKIVLDRPQEGNGKLKNNELHLASMRVGEVPGTHSVLLDIASDQIELKNTSRSREGFALGAIKAAEFIAGKQGFFDFAEVV